MSAKPRPSISEVTLLTCGVVIISASIFWGSSIVWKQFSTAVTNAANYPSSWHWVTKF